VLSSVSYETRFILGRTPDGCVPMLNATLRLSLLLDLMFVTTECNNPASNIHVVAQERGLCYVHRMIIGYS